MVDHQPLAGMAQEDTLSDLQVDVPDIYVRALLRKLMQLRFDASSNISASISGSLSTVTTVTTVATVTTGNYGIGDAGKAASYQQISAMSGHQSRRCFVWE